jgi:hypothetical protein
LDASSPPIGRRRAEDPIVVSAVVVEASGHHSDVMGPYAGRLSPRPPRVPERPIQGDVLTRTIPRAGVPSERVGPLLGCGQDPSPVGAGGGKARTRSITWSSASMTRV